MGIITVSRGTFSGGHSVAECLAERLGHDCLSREQVIEAATAAFGVPVEKLVAAMDRPPAFWERLAGERGDYLNYIRAVLSERARENRLVFHGFVGHLLLGGISHVLRVRVVEDLDVRARIAMERHNLTEKEAIARIKKVDRERTEWTRFLWGVDWKDAAMYDVVLNITRMGVEGACDAVLRMADMEVFHPTPASMKALDNLYLGSRVWVTLATDPATSSAHLSVAAEGGAVTIIGSAPTWDVVDAIPAVASRIPDVKTLRCDVGVTPIYDVPI